VAVLIGFAALESVHGRLADRQTGASPARSFAEGLQAMNPPGVTVG
jgi:hypothetical protein